jgi:hypothetical protein
LVSTGFGPWPIGEAKPQGGKWQLWESKTVADMSALERHKRDPDTISEPDRQTEASLGSSTSPVGAFNAGGAPHTPIRIAERLRWRSATSWSTSMSGSMPLAWIDRPDGAKCREFRTWLQCQHSHLPRLSPMFNGKVFAFSAGRFASQSLRHDCEGPCVHDPRRVRASRNRACRQSRDPHQRQGRDPLQV